MIFLFFELVYMQMKIVYIYFLKLFVCVNYFRFIYKYVYISLNIDSVLYNLYFSNNNLYIEINSVIINLKLKKIFVCFIIF